MGDNRKKDTKKQAVKNVAAGADSEVMDRQVIDLDVNMFVLKSNSVLVLPETPNIYLSPAKAKKLVLDLEKAVKTSRDGVIIRFKGSINPRQENANDDGSMFLTRELSVSEIES
jgi:hypothetical protein